MAWGIFWAEAVGSSTTVSTPKTFDLDIDGAGAHPTTAGDLVILCATSRDDDPSTVTFTDPSGWTALGPTLRHGPSGSSFAPRVAHQSWHRVLDGGEANPSVARTGGGAAGGWSLSAIILRPDGDTPSILDVWDDSTGSTASTSYQGPTLSEYARCTLYLQWVVARADTAGGVQFPTGSDVANGWSAVTPHTGWAGGPPDAIVVQRTTRGSTVESPVLVPSFAASVQCSFLSRSIALRQPISECGGRAGWKVGSL